MDSFIENDQVPDDEDKPDEELEKIRQEGLNKERIDYNSLCKELVSKVDHVHSSFLFFEEGREILRDICKLISSTPSSIQYKSWKDLAGALGLDWTAIGCIEQGKNDYTEMVLLAFIQRPDASLSQLVQAFEQIQRYDALGIAVERFPGLCKIAENQMEKQKNQIICVSEAPKGNEEFKSKLLIPLKLPYLLKNLPITLEENNMCKYNVVPKLDPIENEKTVLDVECGDIVRRINVLVSACQDERRHKHTHKAKASHPCKKAMLTFAEDGEGLAERVIKEFSKKMMLKDGSVVRFGILTLGRFAEDVLQNPSRFITHQFAKMDYIIPILTDGYLDILCNCVNLSSLDHLDSKYIQLIHDHMSKYYIENNCNNDKIRCIIPRGSSVLDHPHVKKDPVFQVFSYDDDDHINKLALRLAMARRKNR